MDVLNIIVNAYSGYAGYLWREITFQNAPFWHNYFFWLLFVSAFFFGIEGLRPWRKEQQRFRKDFWLDFFYMFFNFFLFSLVIFNAVSSVVSEGLNNAILAVSGFNLHASNPMQTMPYWSVLLIGFVLSDFIQWNIHVTLHRIPWLWNFHKLHHSVEQMGFAAHLRYHWMENIVYKSIQYIPLALLGIGLYDFFIIHIFSLAVGHYNHSNIQIPEKIKGMFFGAAIGAFVGWVVLDVEWYFALASLAGGVGFGYLIHPAIKYIFNSPEMHLWHHAYDMPPSHPYGINFGITLSIWDYIFKTDHIPHNRGDIKLGYPGVEQFPQTFVQQELYGFRKEEE
jgi:sterol desaturase/sphingolipid hydroxylase (fatty acid hydroxylase superfamily)